MNYKKILNLSNTLQSVLSAPKKLLEHLNARPTTYTQYYKDSHTIWRYALDLNHGFTYFKAKKPKYPNVQSFIFIHNYLACIIHTKSPGEPVSVEVLYDYLMLSQRVKRDVAREENKTNWTINWNVKYNKHQSMAPLATSIAYIAQELEDCNFKPECLPFSSFYDFFDDKRYIKNATRFKIESGNFTHRVYSEKALKDDYDSFESAILPDEKSIFTKFLIKDEKFVLDKALPKINYLNPANSDNSSNKVKTNKI